MNLPGLLVLQPVALVILGLVAVHDRGRRRLRAGPGDGRSAREERRQSRLFVLGAGLAVSICCSPLQRFAQDDIFASALVEVLLAFLAAPFVVLGAPWHALAAGFGLPPRTRRTGATGSHLRVAMPLVATGSYLAAVWLFHVPSVVDAAAGSLALRSVGLAWFLAAGVVLWSQLVGSHPFGPAWQPLGRVAIVAAVLAGTTFVAVPMVFTSTNWYPALATGPTAFFSAANRMSLAGGALWSLPAIPLGGFAFWSFSEWLRKDADDEWRWKALLEREGATSDTVPVPDRRAGS